MTWTYTAAWLSGASSSTTSMTKIRLMIGDTDSTRQQLQDEEIFYVADQHTALNFAAADCADLLSAKYAYLVGTENSELKISAQARHKHYADLAVRLRKNGPGVVPGGEGAGLVLGGVFAGGTSQSANEAMDNGDNILPPFQTGQDDLPGTGVDPTEYFRYGGTEED